MSIFDFSDGPNQRPKITVAVSTPSTEGVQMIEWLADGVIATSNDDASMLVWETQAGDWEDIREIARLAYDPALGAANSAVRCLLGPQTCMVVGHASGFLTLWVGTDPRNLRLARTPVDLRSAEPTNPWGLQNVRGVSLCSTPSGSVLVYTGSENGLICVVEVPSGNVLSRTVYNPLAKRGINAIASAGKHLVVGNCAVGTTDKNFWYYVLDSATSIPKLVSSFNLEVDHARIQTFCFDVTWCTYHENGRDRVGVLSATEEGYLWLLRLQDDGSLGVVGKEKITSPLGSALAVNTRGQLAVTAYDLYNYQLAQTPLPKTSNHPGQLTAAMLGIG